MHWASGNPSTMLPSGSKLFTCVVFVGSFMSGSQRAALYICLPELQAFPMKLCRLCRAARCLRHSLLCDGALSSLLQTGLTATRCLHRTDRQLSCDDLIACCCAGRPLPPLVNWGPHELDSLTPDAQQILRGPQAFATGSSVQ